MFKCYSSSRGLNRFLEAQKREYETAYQEISEGKKRSHWIWYIYPQIKGLGMSYMDSEYSIKSIQETIEYINNKVLFERLKEMTNLLIKIPHNDIKEVMWYPDDLKLRSCMTLFYVCTGKHIFQNVIDKFYQGERDLKTILILKGMLEKEKNKISEEHFKSLENNIIYLEREEKLKLEKKKEEEAKIKKEKEEEAKIKKEKEKEKEKEKKNEKKNDRDTSVTNNNITEIKIKQLNEDIQNKVNEIKRLKNEVEKYKKESELYKKEMEKYKIENEKLNGELSKLKKIIGGFQNNQIDNRELKNLRDEISTLKYQLNIKNNEINELKLKLQNNGKLEQKINLSDVLVIYFKPVDNSFYDGIKCLANETFAEVEEKLYKKHNDFRNTNNMFTANALPVLRFKTIGENNIHDGDVIQLYRIE